MMGWGCSRDPISHFFTDIFYMECPNFHWLPGLDTQVRCGVMIGLTVLLNIAIAVLILKRKKHVFWLPFAGSMVLAPLAFILFQNTEWHYFSPWICYAGLLLSIMTMLLLISHRKREFAIPIGAVAAIGYLWYIHQSVTLLRYETYADYMKQDFLSIGLSNYEFGFVVWSVCACIVIVTLMAWGVVMIVTAAVKPYERKSNA